MSDQTTPAIKALHAAIDDFSKTSNRQATTMIRLTWAITGLTAAMLVVVVLQVLIAFRPQ